MLLQAGCNAAALRSRNGPLPAKENRAGGIRTRDLLNPIQAHYQAVLRPEGRTIRRVVALAKFFPMRGEKGNVTFDGRNRE